MSVSSSLKTRGGRLTDTSDDARQVLLDVYRRMPAWRKAQLVEAASRTARQLVLIGLRSRHPGEPPRIRPDELQLRQR